MVSAASERSADTKKVSRGLCEIGKKRCRCMALERRSIRSFAGKRKLASFRVTCGASCTRGRTRNGGSRAVSSDFMQRSMMAAPSAGERAVKLCRILLALGLALAGLADHALAQEQRLIV